MAKLPANTVLGNNTGVAAARRPLTVAECNAMGLGGSGSGEVNTGSNVGAAGTGVYDSKSAADLRFRKIRAASSKVTVVLNSQQVDVDVAPAQFTGIPQAGVSSLVSDLALKAPLASPTLTGAPAAPTAAAATSTTQIATTAFVHSVPLDTLAAPTDVTTLNATASAHGLLPKLSNVATEFLNGTGAFSTPAGGLSQAQVMARASYGA